ncbi:hypothetical protein EVAR_84768_1 [Eumeta japonica]|uniref:Kazal-like domain-containing protein n=1 Tax=Eumeta variegata TaxID=151549 RepID=A0A4C1U857_EUMVA|nr:hypothetical protein EVAR_84768_1 [Eumeta japonica]
MDTTSSTSYSGQAASLAGSIAAEDDRLSNGAYELGVAARDGLPLVAVVNFGQGMTLSRAKRQSNDNENAGNTLEDRYGSILGPDWQYPGLFPFPPFPGQNLKSTTTTTTTERSTGNPTLAQERCVRNCPVTPEYNPVCGTDNRTYSNPGKLACAQACGASKREPDEVSALSDGEGRSVAANGQRLNVVYNYS